ncbi:MAG: hypothetical protein ACI9IV_002252 [Paracoccaceae bacterium]
MLFHSFPCQTSCSSAASTNCVFIDVEVRQPTILLARTSMSIGPKTMVAPRKRCPIRWAGQRGVRVDNDDHFARDNTFDAQFPHQSLCCAARYIFTFPRQNAPNLPSTVEFAAACPCRNNLDAVRGSRAPPFSRVDPGRSLPSRWTRRTTRFACNPRQRNNFALIFIAVFHNGKFSEIFALR